MRIFAMAASLAAALGACASPHAGKPPPSGPQVGGGDQIPAPIPAEATVRLGVADAGRTVEVKVGDVVAIALVGVPTAGYVWSPDRTPAFLEKSGETGGPTIKQQTLPGYTGGSHWEVTLYKVTAPGAGTLSLKQTRPWETAEPPADAFAVSVVAR